MAGPTGHFCCWGYRKIRDVIASNAIVFGRLQTYITMTKSRETNLLTSIYNCFALQTSKVHRESIHTRNWHPSEEQINLKFSPHSELKWQPTARSCNDPCNVGWGQTDWSNQPQTKRNPYTRLNGAVYAGLRWGCILSITLFFPYTLTLNFFYF